jgi:subfamily B ATP-binding cassette protein HlyB/CyaB
MSEAQNDIDGGLEALALLLRFHGIAVDTAQIEHQLGGARVKIPEMLRCTKTLKLKARAVTASFLRNDQTRRAAHGRCAFAHGD